MAKMQNNTKKKNNKKGKQGGFTLIELLAVITIMGILMMVAIPAVSRTIENSRRDTFKNTAQQYMSAIRNEVSSDALTCGGKSISALGTGGYYYAFNSSNNTGQDLMESGGKSSWGNSEVNGYVAIYKTFDANGRTSYQYAIRMVDTAKRGINVLTNESKLTRSQVLTSGITNATVGTPADGASGQKFPFVESDGKIKDRTIATWTACQLLV